ncbi:MAG TPA: hypothetical protein VMT62_00790 [Syntrophorhabdaceae bacterium]|nr:hypothetical protein [Syntrophorhabdaceae bacterium]
MKVHAKTGFITMLTVFLILGLSAICHACYGNDQEYIVVFRPGITWQQAAEEVSSWGSAYHLATVTSPTEQQTLQKDLQGLSGEFWLGGYEDPSKKWHWVTSEGWSFARWAKGQPDDSRIRVTDRYLAIGSKYGKDNWMWYGESDPRKIRGFVAERDTDPGNPSPVPLPSATLLFASGLTLASGFRVIHRVKRHG